MRSRLSGILTLVLTSSAMIFAAMIPAQRPFEVKKNTALSSEPVLVSFSKITPRPCKLGEFSPMAVMSSKDLGKTWEKLGLVSAQKHPAAGQTAAVVGEYREYNANDKELPWGDITFNIERNKRTRNYRLWIGSMGVSSMNYHDADASRLQIVARAGTLSFSYTSDGEQCSFSGTVRGGKIMGQLTCTENGQRKSKDITLKKFRAAAT
jgi:hypothetical protein